MNKLIRKNSGLKKFFLGPMCVFYYYFYENYLRMGRAESYAKGWASISAINLFLGPLSLLIIPVDLVNNFAAKNNMVYLRDGGEILFLILAFSLMFLGNSLLRRNHSFILASMTGINLPELPVILSVVLLFGMPLIMIPVTLYKNHAIYAFIFICFYYSAFYVAYFRRLLKDDESKPGPKCTFT
ncbi:hypothetical protein [Rhodanobacter sp. B05]|uniref:hypothetical protein n=1 Tax=Rhodanobacter sp. B05 TaxID=1945859 RepID=UPI0011157A1A|nr:hypothetical protein [Rhodanobacter sp. B05]